MKNEQSGDQWSYEFTSDKNNDPLYKYDQGKEIDYRVSEVAVPFYTSEVGDDHRTITNTYSAGTTSVNVEKIWEDDDNRDGYRPDSITVKLLKKTGEGTPTDTDKTVVLNAANGWKASFTGLQVADGGKEITYSVDEAKFKNDSRYSKDIQENGQNDFTITNTHQVDTGSIKVTKVWDDNNNQDGNRPESIILTLQENGKDVTCGTVTLTADPNNPNQWTGQFENVPLKLRDGFTIVESVPDGTTMPEAYTQLEPVIEKDENGNITEITVTNKLTPATYENGITVTKKWDDDSNRDNVRPEKIRVALIGKIDSDNNGEPDRKVGETSALLSGQEDEWKYTFKNFQFENGMTFDGIPKKYEGKDITYSVEEIIDESWKKDYDPQYTGNAAEGFTITNTHTPGTIDISVHKSWNDNSNADGTRPTGADGITFTLYADGTPMSTLTLTANGNFESKSFEGLPEYKSGLSGHKIDYEVREQAVEGYTNTKIETTSSEDGKSLDFTFTNTQNINIRAEINWEDDQNRDGIRPANKDVIVTLKKDGEPHGNSLPFREDGIVDFGSHQKYGEDGNESEYTIECPGKLAEGKYELQQIGDPSLSTDDDGNVTLTFTVIYKYEPATMNISVHKMWDDGNDADGLRPEEGQSIRVQLLADDVPVPGKIAELTGDDWQGTFENVFVNKSGGQPIQYSVSEMNTPEGYSPSVTPATDSGAEGSGAPENIKFEITNIHTPKTVDIRVVKRWGDSNNADGGREPVEIALYKVVGEGDAKTEVQVPGVDPISLGVNDFATGQFTGLPANENGEPITYVVKEENVPDGYTVGDIEPQTTENKDDITFYVVNTHKQAKKDVTVRLDWNDDDDRDGIRPEMVQVQLYKNGNVPVGDPVWLYEEEGWQHTFQVLPVNENGSKIEYTFGQVSDEQNDYSAGDMKVVTDEETQKTLVITNTHIPETVTISGTKIWDDEENQDNKRPKKITVDLLADGAIVRTTTVTAPADKPDADSWEISFTTEGNEEPLYRYTHCGIPITYTVMEEAVTGYTPGYSELKQEEDENEFSFTLTNQYTPGKTSVFVEKVWKDDNDRDNVRPENIIVELVKNSEGTGETVTLSEDNNWQAQFTGLDEYTNGTRNEYSVREKKEQALSAYETKIEKLSAGNYTITNTYEPGTKSVPVTKVWEDNNNQDGTRPTELTLKLMEGTETIDEVTLTEAKNWTGQFDHVFVNNQDGHEYTIVEENLPAGYTQTSVTRDDKNGFTVVNTLTPETLDIPVEKIWEDGGNRDGIRPQSISVTLTGTVDGQTVFGPESYEIKPGQGETDNWHGVLEGIPKYSGGKAIEYTLSEQQVSGYAAPEVGGTAETGFVIVNSHTPQKPEQPAEPGGTDSKTDSGTPQPSDGNAAEKESSAGNVSDAGTSAGDAAETGTSAGDAMESQNASGAGAAGSAQTGDSANPALWLLLMGISVMLLVVVLTLGKKGR